LHAQVETLIREEIGREGLKPGARLPTEVELCRRFHVSRSTLRQALNRLEMDGTIMRVRGRGTFVSQLDAPAPAFDGQSRPVDLAQPVTPTYQKPGDHKVIGLVFCARSDTLQMNILLGVERAAKSRGYAVMFGYSGEDARTEAQEIERLCRIGADGIVVMPVSNAATTPGVQMLVEKQIPVVLVDRYLSELETSYVVSDGFDGMYRVTEHLIILGYEQFVFITSGREQLSTTSVMERYRGYCTALEDYCLPEQVKPPVPVPLHDPDAIRQVLTDTYRVGTARPPAIVCVHDAVAINFMKTAASIAQSPPLDFAVVGFDDLPIASHLPVQLTTVSQPRYDMGFRAAHLLIDQIERGDYASANERLVLPVSLVVRESCGARRIVCGRKLSL
jgi:GntR family transcriptional regulator of arabinose operon